MKKNPVTNYWVFLFTNRENTIYDNQKQPEIE